MAAATSKKNGSGGLIFLQNRRWQQVFDNIIEGCSDMVWILEDAYSLKHFDIASVGVTPRTKQLGVTPRTPLFEGKNPENQKTKISIKKGRLLLVNDQGFSQIRPT